MAEYTSLKVPELKKLLAEKGLSQTGNKADLIARLNEHDRASGDAGDEQPAAEAAGEAKKPESKEDEITYSDDEAPKAAPPAATAAAPTAETKGEETATEANDGPKPADSEPAPVDAPAAPEPPSYAAGLSSTTADEEAKKRADRAKRFGIEEDEDAKKRAERAARFGLDEKELATGLDSALPERALKRGRGREGGDGGRPGKRQSLDRRGGGRQRGRGKVGGGGGGGGARDGAPKASSIMDDPVEKAKAEKRAARFAAA